jgi:transposase InsO family protein
MNSEYPTRLLCRTLNVSPSGYYDWQHRHAHPGRRNGENALLLQAIEQIHQNSRQTYGSPRIQQALLRSGRRHGRNRIARLMRQNNIHGRARRRYRVCTTDSRHDHPVAPNRLAASPPPDQPNQIWLADITYIPTDEGWLYLAGILDVFSRKIVGWAMDQSIDTRLVLSSWNMALKQRQPTSPLLFHSDRGCQYASAEFRHALHLQNAVASMSRKANCYDNAIMESFWSTLKHELIYRSRFRTRAEARTAIFEFIEVFYNRTRLHSSLNYLSPVDFENQNN